MTAAARDYSTNRLALSQCERVRMTHLLARETHVLSAALGVVGLPEFIALSVQRRMTIKNVMLYKTFILS
jgi:hypothetical protein